MSARHLGRLVLAAVFGALVVAAVLAPAPAPEHIPPHLTSPTGALCTTDADCEARFGGEAGPCVNCTPEEDEPGWDCATMGNHSCGPISVTVDPLTVDPAAPYGHANGDPELYPLGADTGCWHEDEGILCGPRSLAAPLAWDYVPDLRNI